MNRIKVCGWLVDEEETVKWGLEQGLKTDGSEAGNDRVILMSLLLLEEDAGVFGLIKYMGVTLGGESFMCLAVATTHPFKPLDMPTDEEIERLKEAIGAEMDPTWFDYDG